MAKFVRLLKQTLLFVFIFTLWALIQSSFMIQPASHKPDPRPIVEGWPPTQSRNMSLYVKDPIVRGFKMCDWRNKKSKDAPIRFLIVVKSSNTHPGLRQRYAIRKTWANSTELPPDARVIFVFGRDDHKPDPSLTALVREESESHCDTVKVNIYEAETNNTLKMVSMLKHLDGNKLVKPEYILFTDDSTFVNAKLMHSKIFQDVTLYYENELAIIGRKYSGQIFRPDPKADYPFVRDRVCPEYMWNGESFPSFISGSGYIVPFEAVPCLTRQSMKLPFLHLDDVFITGLAAEDCNIDRINSDDFSMDRRLLNDMNENLLVIPNTNAVDMEIYRDYFHGDISKADL